MANLFDLSADLLEFEAILTENDGEIPEEFDAQVSAWLGSVAAEVDTKIDNYAGLIREMESRAKIRKEEAERLAKLQKTDEAAAKRLKTILQWFFEAHRLQKKDTKRFKLWMQKNGGVTPMILDPSVELDPGALPEKFQKVTIEPNTPLIRAALEAGEELEFARFGERGTSLRIK